jgi:hypothetical protein
VIAAASYSPLVIAGPLIHRYGELGASLAYTWVDELATALARRPPVVRTAHTIASEEELDG